MVFLPTATAQLMSQYHSIIIIAEHLRIEDAGCWLLVVVDTDTKDLTRHYLSYVDLSDLSYYLYPSRIDINHSSFPLFEPIFDFLLEISKHSLYVYHNKNSPPSLRCLN